MIKTIRQNEQNGESLLIPFAFQTFQPALSPVSQHVLNFLQHVNLAITAALGNLQYERGIDPDGGEGKEHTTVDSLAATAPTGGAGVRRAGEGVSVSERPFDESYS